MLDKLIGPALNVIDKLVPDRAAAAEAKAELQKLIVETDRDLRIAQTEVNRQEAAHKSLFVAGWRPGVGWVCVIGLAVNVIIIPMLPAHWGFVPQTDVLMPLVLGMLGMGGMRSFEKMNRVAREK